MIILRWGYAPTEVREAVRPILLQYLWLLPGWCRQLVVTYRNEDPSEGDAEVVVQPEYRQAEITICSGWLDANPTQRRLEIVHELLHVPLAPITVEQQDTIDRLFVDGDAPKFKDTLQEHWRKAFEGTVQDLAFAILQIDPKHLPTSVASEEEDEDSPLKATG